MRTTDKVALRQLRLLLPRNAQDADAARRLVALGPDPIAPLVPEMLRRLGDHGSPVADVYCGFLAASGAAFVEEIRSVLARATLPAARRRIVTDILPHWDVDSLRPLVPVLQLLVSRIDGFDTDLHCIRLLALQRLTDPGWLRQWLQFRLERLRASSRLAEEIGRELD